MEEKEENFLLDTGDPHQAGPWAIPTHCCDDNISKFLTKNIGTMEIHTRKVNAGNAREAFEEIMALLTDSRLFLAHELLDRLEGFLMRNPDLQVTKDLKRELEMSQNQKRIKQLHQRVQMLRSAIQDFDMEEQWALVHKVNGITTSYKSEVDGSLTIKLQGTMNTKFFFDQLAAIREADEYTRWMPHLTRSRMLKEIGKFEVVIWYNLNIPFFGTRDCCLHMFGCDHLDEGMILLMGSSVEEFEGVEIPAKPTGWTGRRSEIHDIRVRFRNISPSSYDIDIVFNLNPKLPLPRWVVNFSLKKLSGSMLYYMAREAVKSAADPINSPYAVRMRNHSYYTGYVAPRVAAYFNAKKWNLLSFPALEISKDKVKNETEAAALNLWQDLIKENDSSLQGTPFIPVDVTGPTASVV